MDGGKGMKLKGKAEGRMGKAPQRGEGGGLVCRCGRFPPAYSCRSMFRPGFSASC